MEVEGGVRTVNEGSWVMEEMLGVPNPSQRVAIAGGTGPWLSVERPPMMGVLEWTRAALRSEGETVFREGKEDWSHRERKAPVAAAVAAGP